MPDQTDEQPSLKEKLSKIQQTIHVPKSNWNEYGGYAYRSAEDILAALKPMLHDAGLFLVLSDTVVSTGGWNYVKATAMLSDGVSEPIETHGYAREQETRKGMDAAQITGAASSYARKYALNALLLIDDVLDNDKVNDGDGVEDQEDKGPLMTPEQVIAITKLVADTGKSLDKFVTHMEGVTGEKYGSIDKMPQSVYQRCLYALGQTPGKK